MDLQKISTGEAAVTAYAESRTGGRRENQDSYGWTETPLGYLVTVCDGMGGGPGGKTASATAVNEIVAAFTEASQNPGKEPEKLLVGAVRRANKAIYDIASADPHLHGMGTTCTVLLITKERAFVAHVGDSRVYQFRGQEKVFRTRDHSLVFDLVEQGVMTEEQARLSNRSNIITRALGIDPDVEIDTKPLEYKAGDRFMLCTDGIHGCMEEQRLIALATSTGEDLGEVVDNLAARADDIGNSGGGGHDNLTLAMVETAEGSSGHHRKPCSVTDFATRLFTKCHLDVL